MTRMRMWGGVVTVLCLTLVGTPGLQAQSTQTDWNTRIAKAELLSEYGIQLAKYRLDYDDASSYLREAAELRGQDSEAVHELIQAGKMAYYAGLGLRAVSALNSAGKLAEVTGDYVTAAKAYRDAAWVAYREGERPTARNLFERSESLLRIGQNQPDARQ